LMLLNDNLNCRISKTYRVVHKASDVVLHSCLNRIGARLEMEGHVGVQYNVTHYFGQVVQLFSRGARSLAQPPSCIYRLPSGS
jgi:hypothetical protein